MPHRGIGLYGEMQMNDEDDDMLFSVLFVALTVAVVLFVVGGIGVVLWSVFT
jgi:hypothetical protein